MSRGHEQARRAERRRGAVLLECVLALALFVACGLSVLALMDHAVDSVASTRDTEQAADLARTTMARVEAGIASPDTLNGPVLDENGEKSGAWALEVQTEPSQFEGLAKVTVRAIKHGVGESELASFTLHQLVRLTEKTDVSPRAPVKVRETKGAGGKRP
jgi:hypothetical protein